MMAELPPQPPVKAYPVFHGDLSCKGDVPVASCRFKEKALACPLKEDSDPFAGDPLRIGAWYLS